MQKQQDFVFEECRDVVAKRLGLWFSDDRSSELKRGFERTFKELAVDATELWNGLKSGHPHLLKSFLQNLTIGETYFYRDRTFYDALEHRIINRDFPDSAKESRSLRIWSAGCSTGEEAYSLAIALQRNFLGIQSWNVEILATDVNERSLTKCRDAQYGKWSFRDTPDWLKSRYFQETECGRQSPLPMVRDLVTFRRLNLAKDHYPSVMPGWEDVHLICCRNVLMYLEPDKARQAVEKFVQLLAPGGCLVVSPVDVGLLSGLGLQAQEGGFFCKVAEDLRAIEVEFVAETPMFSNSAAITEQTSSEQDFAGSKERALRLLRTGLWNAARSGFLEQKPEESQDGESAVYLAYCLAQLGESSEALMWLEKSEQWGQSDLDVRGLQAIVLRDLGRHREAYDLLRKELYLQPEHEIFHFLMAVVITELGKPDLARKHFQRTDFSERLGVEPQTGELLALLGVSE